MVAVVMSTPEMVWVERARQGDTPPSRHGPPLRAADLRLTYRMMGGNTADAEDLTQETFIKAYRALDRTTDLLHVSAWLHRIAANTCHDEWRRRRRAGCQPWDASVHEAMLPSRPEENPESLMLQKEADERVQAILNRMKPRNKQALVLREYGASPARRSARSWVSRTRR